jgi:hypothetical protein
MDRLHIDAKDDLILRLAHRDQPVAGLIELIWNSLDAEAHRVEVIIERDAMDGVERVQVLDDGHGIAPEGIPTAFGLLGGSWKAKAMVSPTLKRRMNGSNGQGRIRGFALGNAATRLAWVACSVSVVSAAISLIHRPKAASDRCRYRRLPTNAHAARRSRTALR